MNWFKQILSDGQVRDGQGRADAEPRGMSSEHRRVIEMLVLVCTGNYQNMVTNTELGASWKGTFDRIEDTSIFVLVELNEVEALLDPGAFCTVSFTYDKHSQVFLTTVKHSGLLEDGRLEIELFVPDAVHAAGRRELYRVPVLLDIPITAEVSNPSGDVFPARVQDINTSGIRVKIDEAHLNLVNIGEQIELTLNLGDLTTRRAADLRHKDLRNSALGLHFLETVDTVAQQQMRFLVKEAERCYLLRINRRD